MPVKFNAFFNINTSLDIAALMNRFSVKVFFCALASSYLLLFYIFFHAAAFSIFTHMKAKDFADKRTRTSVILTPIRNRKDKKKKKSNFDLSYLKHLFKSHWSSFHIRILGWWVQSMNQLQFDRLSFLNSPQMQSFYASLWFGGLKSHSVLVSLFLNEHF